MIGTRICVQALRQDDSDLEGTGWQNVVYNRLNNTYKRQRQGAGTHAAEQGLGMPTSAYWYLCRIEPSYPHAIILSRTPAPHPTPTAGMVCPFDTGGLWADKMRPKSRFRNKQFFLRRHAFNLDNYHKPMREWITSAYPPTSADGPPIHQYAIGKRPERHFIQNVELTTTQDWIWELSVATTAPSDAFPTPTSLHLTTRQYELYTTWLENNTRLSPFDFDAHLDLLTTVVSLSTNPFHDAIEHLRQSAEEPAAN